MWTQPGNTSITSEFLHQVSMWEGIYRPDNFMGKQQSMLPNSLVRSNSIFIEYRYVNPYNIEIKQRNEIQNG